MEHERHPPATWSTPAAAGRRPAGGTAGQGERDVDLAGPGGIGETAGKNLPFPEAAGIALLAGAINWTMPGVTPNDLITVSAAWGTRITTAGESRA